MATVKKAQNGRISCPKPGRDRGEGLLSRLQGKIGEGVERREIKRTERKMQQEEANTPSFKGVLGKSNPPSLVIDYTDRIRKNRPSEEGKNTAKKGTKLSKSMSCGGKMKSGGKIKSSSSFKKK